MLQFVAVQCIRVLQFVPVHCVPTPLVRRLFSTALPGKVLCVREGRESERAREQESERAREQESERARDRESERAKMRERQRESHLFRIDFGPS